MCRALDAAGVETLLATTDADGADGRLDVETGRPVRHEGVSTTFFPRTASESFKYAAGLRRWLDREVSGFDVVHVHAVFSFSSLGAGSACRRHRVPYVVRPLGSLDPWSLRRHRARKRMLLALGGRRLLERAAAIHYTSVEERRLAEGSLRHLPSGHVIPLGVDDALFGERHDGRAEAGRYVLALCRLDPKKNLELLVEAFHEAVSDPASDGWSLVIAGTGEPPYVEQLHAIARRGPARDRIRFAGWVDGDERAQMLRRAALFALPSHQENFGIAVAEALAGGVPAIVTPAVNLAADICTAGAGWVAEPSRPALVRALLEGMADEPGREARGRAARQLAERFRWPAVADRLIQLYDELRSR
jgi:glycosyltransferase involved in cell wall biosynthesis